MSELYERWGRLLTGSAPLPSLKLDEGRAQSILRGIKRQKGWRSDRTTEGQSPMPEDPMQARSWLQERQARTLQGSLLQGTTHFGSHLQADRRNALLVAVPQAALFALEALKDGKKVTIITEGHEFNPDTSKPGTSEGDMLASVVYRASKDIPKAIVDYQTWDDDPVNVLSSRSPIWTRLTEAEGGDLNRAKACIAIRMMGLGMQPSEVKEAGLLTAEAQGFIERLLDQELPEKLNKSIRNLLYQVAFPHEFGEESNEVSALGDLYDAVRQSNILRKIREAERKGFVAVVLTGVRHAYNLKPVLELDDEEEEDGETPSSEADTSKLPGAVKLALEQAWGARIAVTRDGILKGIDPKIVSRAKSVKVNPKKADPNNAMWVYSIPGSKGDTYTVKVKGVPKKNQTKVLKMDLLVSCTCDFFRWQGPEHWAKIEGYLFGKPKGTAEAPQVKDTNGKNRVCKHIVAVLERGANWIYTPR